MAAPRRAPHVVLAAVVVLPALPLAGAAAWAMSSGQPDAPVASAALPPDAATAEAPVLSLRRTPETVSAAWSDIALARALTPVVDELDDPSCLLVLAGDTTVTSVRPVTPVVPASNMKILTASVLLDLVGSDWRYVTRVAGEMDADGVVDGDLVLVGGGDPMLATAWYPESFTATRYPQQPATSLEDLADAVLAAGVTAVRGDVVGDESRYDDEYFRPAWGESLRVSVAGPYSALLVDDARLQGGGVASVPALGAAQVFRDLLVERGVDVAGGASTGTADADASEIASVSSAPLGEIVAHVLSTSDNTAAEMMLKEIAVASGRPGTSDDGLAALVENLSARGVDVTGLAPTDGSGLDIDSLATCASLVGALAVDGPGSTLVDAMPLLGTEGTLAGVLDDHPLAGRLHAKTGSLGEGADRIDVKALSGVFAPETAAAVTFALVLNGGTVREEATFLPIWTDLADALAAYPAAPDATAIAPGGGGAP